MSRSNFTEKFTIHNISEFEKQFKKQYKEEHNEDFKGNVLDAITIGVIREKGLPDVSDTVRIVKLGCFKATDESIETRIQNGLETDEYKERGITGIFCDACKDLTIDIPLNKQFVQSILGLEDTINKRQDAKNKMQELMSKLSSLGDKLKDAVENTDEQKEKEVETPVVSEGA